MNKDRIKINGLKNRWQQWLSQRMPAQTKISLNQRRIFIIPSAQGVAFLVMLGLLFVLAINYQNSLVFALCFLLTGVFIVSIFHTFLNLHALQIKSFGALPCFAESQAAYRIELHAQERDYFLLELNWVQQLNRRLAADSADTIINVESGSSVQCSIPFKASKRGYCNPGRLRVRTVYPLGLLQSWSWLDFGRDILVYPKPETVDEFEQTQARAEELNSAKNKVDSEGELYGFRKYQAGDPLKHVDWKSLAKGQPLMTKQYRQYQQQKYYLDWHALSAASTERRLSQLCYLALDWHQRGWSFGLKLPNETIELGSGRKHLQHILKILALYS